MQILVGEFIEILKDLDISGATLEELNLVYTDGEEMIQHFYSSWDKNAELDFAIFQWLYTENAEFPILDTDDCEEAQVYEYYRRVAQSIGRKSPNIKDFLLVPGNTQCMFLIPWGVYFVPSPRSGIFTLERVGDSITIYSSFVDDIKNLSHSLTVKEGKGSYKIICAAGWQRKIATDKDFYRNPNNRGYWETVPYFRWDKAYEGVTIFVSNKEICYIKTNESLWLPLQVAWLEVNLDELSEPIRNEFLLYKNMTK